MSCEVYANGDEIACKGGDNKVIAAMPDVCLSPPSPPAGPIPVPYPNTSFSKDMQKGSKTVLIKGKEVMLKDQSFYKTSPLGDEAATKGLGAGVITHVITGKTYCVAWSMDVKFEGQNVDRHTDMTTSNHASPMGDGPFAPTAAKATDADVKLCPCCKAPMHSKEQETGPSMTQEEWYTPNAEARKKKPPTKQQAYMMDYAALVIADAKARGCNNVQTDPNEPCAKFYALKPGSKKSLDKEYDESLRPASGEEKRARGEITYVEKYGKSNWRKIKKRMAKLQAKQKAEGTSIAHVTPRAAGGCPFGTNNVKVVPKECEDLEKELATVQKDISDYHKR